MIDLNEEARKANKISIKRSRNGSEICQDLLKHAAGEIVEATVARAAYMKVVFDEEISNSIADARFTNYAEELADVIICILIEAAINGVNIEQAVIDKMEKNRLRAEKQGDKL